MGQFSMKITPLPGSLLGGNQQLAGAERLGGAVEAEMFGDGKRLDQRCKWNAPQTKLMAWRI